MKNYPDTKTWIQSVISKHLGANIRSFKWTTWLGAPKENSLGGLSFLRPQEGKVVEMDDNFVLIKTKPSEFCIVARELLDKPVQVDSKVKLSFYDLRGFDGLKSDGCDDPHEGNVRSFMLSGAYTQFPAIWDGRHENRSSLVTRGWTTIQNSYLRDLIKQLETIRVDGGRNLVSILVDAKGSNLSFSDPADDESCNPDTSKWPAISVTVNSEKFSGQVTIRYDRGMDVYEIAFQPTVGEAVLHEMVHIDDLSPILVDGIDDGTWKNVKVEVLKAAPKTKTQQVLLAA